MLKIFAALALIILIAGCSSNRIKTADVDDVQADCSNVDETIAMLNEQKDGGFARVKAGVQSVVPTSAAVNIVTGNYKENVSVATGKRGEKIDSKLEEMNALKERCASVYR